MSLGGRTAGRPGAPDRVSRRAARRSRCCGWHLCWSRRSRGSRRARSLSRCPRRHRARRVGSRAPLPAQCAPHERSGEAAAPRGRADEQVFEPAVVDSRPDAVTEPELAHGRRGLAVGRGEPELGIGALDQQFDRSEKRSVGRPRPSLVVAELDQQPGDDVSLRGRCAPDPAHAAARCLTSRRGSLAITK